MVVFYADTGKNCVMLERMDFTFPDGGSFRVLVEIQRTGEGKDQHDSYSWFPTSSAKSAAPNDAKATFTYINCMGARGGSMRRSNFDMEEL